MFETVFSSLSLVIFSISCFLTLFLRYTVMGTMVPAKAGTLVRVIRNQFAWREHVRTAARFVAPPL